MTREEIIKAADEAVEMFEGYYAECGGFVRRMTTYKAIGCAILHYEKIVERDEFWFKELQIVLEKIAKHYNSSLTDVSSPALDESKAILTELKSRL